MGWLLTGRPAQARSWSKKPSGSSARPPVPLVPALGATEVFPTLADGNIGNGRDLQLLTTGLHGLHGAVEHDLEAGQLLIGVVLGLVAHAPGFLVGVVEDALGHVVGLPHDLGALDHPFCLDPHLLQQGVGLTALLGQELVPLLQEPTRLAQLVGHTVEGRLQQLGQLFSRHQHRGRQRHGLGRLDQVQGSTDQRLGVELLTGSPLFFEVLEEITHRNTSPAAAGLPLWERMTSRRRRTGPPPATTSRR